jgi:hypothetical protein
MMSMELKLEVLSIELLLQVWQSRSKNAQRERKSNFCVVKTFGQDFVLLGALKTRLCTSFPRKA